MWLIIVIVIILTAAWAFIANSNKKEAQQIVREQEQTHILAERYNNSLHDFDMAYKAAKTKADAFNDVSASMKLTNINRSYEEAMIDAKSRLESLLIATSGLSKLQQENLAVDGLLNDMETFTELVQQLKCECKQEYSPEMSQPDAISTDNNSGYFAGCITKEDATKRWRALCKIYHPDSGSGDAETFKIIRKEYDHFEEKQ